MEKSCWAAPSFTSNDDWQIVRVLPNGTVDTDFGSEGRVFGGTGSCRQLVLEPNGNILAVGSDGDRLNLFAVIRRYSPSGTKLNETTLNLLKDQGGFLQNSFSGLLRQPDGRILVIGRGSNENSVTDTNALLRFKSDLTLDATFTLGDQADTIAANNLLQQPDGKLILTNSTQTARYFPLTNSTNHLVHSVALFGGGFLALPKQAPGLSCVCRPACAAAGAKY